MIRELLSQQIVFQVMKSNLNNKTDNSLINIQAFNHPEISENILLIENSTEYPHKIINLIIL